MVYQLLFRGFPKWGYPQKCDLYNGQPHLNRLFGATPILEQTSLACVFYAMGQLGPKVFRPPLLQLGSAVEQRTAPATPAG